jgi:hypothetical protein
LNICGINFINFGNSGIETNLNSSYKLWNKKSFLWWSIISFFISSNHDLIFYTSYLLFLRFKNLLLITIVKKPQWLCNFSICYVNFDFFLFEFNMIFMIF